MRVVIAGGHGQIALRLEKLLSERGDQAAGIVRNPAHEPDLTAVGAETVVLDLEKSDVDAVAAVLEGADAAVFAAGAGPGSGNARKDTVDRGAAALFADAAERAGVRRFIQVGSMGADNADAPGLDPTFAIYLRAKKAAEDDLRARDLDWTILRPGGLTNESGTGRVKIADHTGRGSVPREDVAATLVGLLDAPATARRTLELISGETPVDEAISGA
ncbi:NAD(P)H-binding protein [Amycolatopsis saalfeldensis]|uniref:Putative NADH-flavin reductase n=1 Tax=Amycolatopsis saalfeldensis TaxID=394193 RepID=A0A1H8YNY0_9PSEU|nr:NAD(P)H-binding protein [Amycolatopsis saalfeldensis]SEP53859.1 Putative NADH-flavin reductase [Amycolatopsis saalfeldensis]